MSKWEDKYEQYKKGGIDNIISELTAKGISTKEEKKEYKKLIKIKDKMPQIENVVEYRDKLKEELEQIKKEIETRKSLEEAADKRDKLEKEIAEYQDKYEKINKELKNKDLTDEKRSKLEAEKTEISEKMPKAQEERDKAEDTLIKGLGEKRELSTLGKQEIEKKMFETQTRVSKCNLVANNLLNGLNWEQIDMKLDNWKDRKFTSKDESLAKSIEAAKKARKEKVNNFELKIEDPNKAEVDLLELAKKAEKEAEYPEDPKYNKPALTFADKHPRLARIGNFFKRRFEDIKDRFSKKEQTIEDIEKDVEKDVEKEGKSFKDEIKVIAKVGYKDVRKEELKNDKDLRARYEAMKEANRKAEEEKFGKDYADMSRNTEER